MIKFSPEGTYYDPYFSRPLELLFSALQQNLRNISNLQKLHPPNIMDAHDYLRKGHSKDWLGAIESFTRAIALGPNNPAAHIGRDIARRRKKDLKWSHCRLTQARLFAGY